MNVFIDSMDDFEKVTSQLLKRKQNKKKERKEKKRKEKKREEKERKEKKRREKYIYHISTAFLRHKPPADTSLINTKTIILDLEG